MPIEDKLNVLGPVRVIVVPLVGPFCGKLTSVPGATVAALSGGINAKKSAKPNAPPAGPVGPVAPVEPLAPLSPDGPVAPVSPTEPVAPLFPAGPVAPVEPVAPLYPDGIRKSLPPRFLYEINFCSYIYFIFNCK